MSDPERQILSLLDPSFMEKIDYIRSLLYEELWMDGSQSRHINSDGLQS